jgi:hypothetical protein
VTVREVETRHLLTVRVPSPDGFAVAPDVKGAIVRIQPLPGATDEQVEAARQWAVAAGAVKVWSLLRKRSRVPKPREAAKPSATAREVVMAMAEESVTSDRAALKAALEAALSAGGL